MAVKGFLGPLPLMQGWLTTGGIDASLGTSTTEAIERLGNLRLGLGWLGNAGVGKSFSTEASVPRLGNFLFPVTSTSSGAGILFEDSAMIAERESTHLCGGEKSYQTRGINTASWKQRLEDLRLTF